MALHVGARGPGHLSRATVGVTPSQEGGTSATRYSFAGTHMRRCVESQQIVDAGEDPTTGTKRVIAIDHCMHMPDYATTEHRFHIPNSYHGTTGDEVKTTSDIIIHKAAVKVVDDGLGGTWYPIPDLPMTITPGMDGGWLPALAPGVTIPANSKIILRYVYELPALSGNLTVFPIHSWRNVPYGDKQEGFTGANLASALALVPTSGTSETALSNASGRWLPASMCVAKGGDGRPAFVIVGDSNGYGAFASGIYQGHTARGAWGHLDVGLDDDATSQRLAYANVTVPGQGFSGFQNRSRWQVTLNAIKYIYDTHGYWPFDEVLDEMVENSLGASSATAIIPYQELLKTEWDKPVIKVQPLCRPSSSSDQYATVAGQSTDATNTYPTGDKWLFNAACEPGGSLRTGGYIDDTFAPWSYECADPLTNDRDVLAVKAFSTTLAAGFTAPASFQLNHQPTIGAALMIAGVTGYAHIQTVTGSGPYTVTLYAANNFSGTVSSGAVVREVAHGDSLHPSCAHHRDTLSAAAIGWKIARGWV